MNDIIFCIVLYKKDFDTSETLQSISNWTVKGRERISQLIVWDNSPNCIEKEIIKKKKDEYACRIDYYHNGKNNSLSYIYNNIIKKLSDNSILVLLDHDSNLPEEYMEELIKSSNLNPDINLFLPQIIYSNQLVSPSWSWYFLGKYLDTVQSGRVKSKNMMAINSGMAIRSNYLKYKFEGYNEHIKFYGTDNDFMWKYAVDNKYVYIMETQIHHILNFYDEKDTNKQKARLKDIKNGMFQILKQRQPLLIPLARIYWWVFSLKFKLLNRNEQK